jgi:glycosyltransferase involved in cell wall biosynthesis
MKYGLITPEYPPFYGGGIATYCENLVVGLATECLELHVFVPDWHNKVSNKRQDGLVTIHHISIFENAKEAIHLTGFMLASFAISKYLQSQSSTLSLDVIEAVDFGALGYYTIKAKLLDAEFFANSKFIVTSHGPKAVLANFSKEDRYRLPEYFVQHAELWTMQAADLIIFPTEFAREIVCRMIDVREKSKVQVFPFKPISSLEVSLTTESKQFTSIYFGRKNEIKGLDIYLEAVKLVKANQNVAFLGEDAWLPSSEQFASNLLRRELSEKNIVYTDFGKVRPEQILDVLKKSHVVVMPSRIEWFSYAYLECASAGLRTILNENTGAAELARFLEDKRSIITNGTSKEIAGVLEDIQASSNIKSLDVTKLKVFEPTINARERLKLIERIPIDKSSIYPQTSRRGVHKPVQHAAQLSVVIPYFNAGDTLRETLSSLQAQSDFVGEIIVVDDGSDQPNKDILEELSQTFSFKTIRQENMGLPSTRNTGLKSAEYPCILFLDSDDLILDGYLRKSLDILNRFSNVAGVGAWVQTFGLVEGVWETFDGFLPLNHYKNCLNSASIIWRTDVVKSVGGFDEEFIKGFEDWNLVNRILAEGWAIPVLDLILFQYRTRQGSMFAKLSASDKAELYEVCIRSGLTEELLLSDVKRLEESNGMGYNFTYLLLPPANSTEYEAQNTMRDLARRYPILRNIWNRMPQRYKNITLGLFNMIR